MVVNLTLAAGKESALKAEASSHGLSTEEFVSQILNHELESAVSPSAQDLDARPISKVIAEIMADAPPKELAKLPKDGASEHDHYLYGWPKRNR